MAKIGEYQPGRIRALKAKSKALPKAKKSKSRKRRTQDEVFKARMEGIKQARERKKKKLLSTKGKLKRAPNKVYNVVIEFSMGDMFTGGPINASDTAVQVWSSTKKMCDFYGLTYQNILQSIRIKKEAGVMPFHVHEYQPGKFIAVGRARMYSTDVQIARIVSPPGSGESPQESSSQEEE